MANHREVPLSDYVYFIKRRSPIILIEMTPPNLTCMVLLIILILDILIAWEYTNCNHLA